MTAKITRTELLAALSGISIGEAADDAKSPLSIWEGSGKSNLKGTVNLQAGYFDQGSSWFGKDQENLGQS